MRTFIVTLIIGAMIALQAETSIALPLATEGENHHYGLNARTHSSNITEKGPKDSAWFLTRRRDFQ